MKFKLFSRVLFVTSIGFLFLAATCVKNHSGNLKKIGQYNLTIPEPSGVTLDPDMKHLWMVSDQKGQIYKTDLQGVVQSQIDIKSSDYEGIAISQDGQLIYIVDEAKNKIRCFDLEGNKVKDKALGTKVSKKSGPEGIDIDWTSGDFYVVNENDPTIVYQLDADLNIKRSESDIAMSDLSAICVNPENKDIFLMSDEDQKIVQVSADYAIKHEYLIDIQQMEGLAIDFKKRRMYIVSDAEEELHIFEY